MGIIQLGGKPVKPKNQQEGESLLVLCWVSDKAVSGYMVTINVGKSCTPTLSLCPASCWGQSPTLSSSKGKEEEGQLTSPRKTRMATTRQPHATRSNPQTT